MNEVYARDLFYYIFATKKCKYMYIFIKFNVVHDFRDKARTGKIIISKLK